MTFNERLVCLDGLSDTPIQIVLLVGLFVLLLCPRLDSTPVLLGLYAELSAFLLGDADSLFARGAAFVAHFLYDFLFIG